MEELDFEGTESKESNSTVTQTDVTTKNDVTTEDKTNLGGSTVSNLSDEETEDKSTKDDNSSTGQLNVGDSVEVDGVVYTVAENGNLVDDKGNVFKEAKDIPEWLKSVNVEENEANNISISSIQEALGITITDEKGEPVEFTNTPEGVNSYVNSVIELKSNELQQAAINKLYTDNPLLKQFQDYVQITGSPRGFGELPDRSGIQIEKDNEAQQIAIIRMAAQEFGNRALNDNYIKYLRDSGGLYDEAKDQLQALVEKDEAVRKDIETRAAKARAEEQASVEAYWKQVNDVVTNRKIGNYKIPENITKEVNGQKVVLNTKDFFNYLSQSKPMEDGTRMTGYQADLAKLTDEEYMQREILDAWLMFTGGTYKDLIDMAIKEDKVRQLKIKSQEQRANKSIKIVRNNNVKTSIDDIIL